MPPGTDFRSMGAGRGASRVRGRDMARLADALARRTRGASPGATPTPIQATIMSTARSITVVGIHIALAAFALGLARPSASHAQHATHHEEGAAMPSPDRIPESIRVEHEEIHAELVRATEAPGAVGVAARELAAVLHPHFVREEQIALPPLALLGPLSRGETSPAMRAVLPLTDSLRAELPRMLEEHVKVRAATLHLGEVARAAGNEQVAHLADKLAVHAQTEEELFYPAAVLVGDLVRARVPER